MGNWAELSLYGNVEVSDQQWMFGLYLILSFRWFCLVSILNVPSTQAETVEDCVLLDRATVAVNPYVITLMYKYVFFFSDSLEPKM